MSTLFIPHDMPAHDQLDIHADLPVHHDEHGRRLAAYPCAIPGINLTDYSTNPQGKGWGPHCTGPFTTITLALSGRRVTVDSRLAELAALIMNANERDGYLYDAYTGAYNCRYIGGTTIWSNHAWGLAIDGNWDHNPQHSPLITDQPVWLRQRWNRYGWAWGGDYTAPTIPDAMHDEFMGSPAQAVSATNLARAELAGTDPVVVPPPPDPGPDAQARQDQFDLSDTGFPCVVDGYWGPASAAACRAFQVAARRPVTGTMSGGDRAAIHTVPSWHSGGDIADDPGGYPARQWQQKLAGHGWHISVDNVWGAHSRSILSQFQADKGITVDGNRGPQSWTCLYCTTN